MEQAGIRKDGLSIVSNGVAQYADEDDWDRNLAGSFQEKSIYFSVRFGGKDYSLFINRDLPTSLPHVQSL